jgi:hypothetical protein
VKRKYPIFRIILMVLLVLATFYSTSSAASLSLEATSDGSTVETEFYRGDNLFLNIIIDNAGGVAGCAFTVEYPASVLEAPATTAEGLPVTAGEITSLFPFTYETEETHRENSSESGKIYFAGAEIDTDDGGAKYDSGEVTLFTIKFKVKNDATLGAFSLSLSQTELFNPAAGWGYDDDGDGVFDVGDGDTKDPVPVLVGAVDNQDPNWEDLTLAFPVILGDGSNPFTTVTNDTCEVIPPKYAISGSVNYSGYQSGTLYVAAFDTGDTTFSTPIGGVSYPWSSGTTSKGFTISVPDGDYYLAAYIDSDASDFPPDDWESNGKYLTQITISGADDETSRVIDLEDPLDGGTGEPLYYENWKTDNGWTIIGVMANDYDDDGYTNIEEFVNGTNPTVQDQPFDLDIDGNGAADALTDGILIIRYLFDFRGNPLIDGAVAPNATRTTAADIEAYLADGVTLLLLDIDGNGAADALTDGILIIRYLFDFRGNPLIDGAVAPNATRDTAVDIEAFMGGLIP